MIVKVHCQTLLQPNEQTIFYFKTKAGKEVLLAKDAKNAYIIYRYGMDGKAEFEFPQKTKESWQKFSYSFYLRGGGVANDGMDLNYVSFSNNGFHYVIYDSYYAVEEKSIVGVRVVDLNKTKKYDIKGDIRTRKGTMVDFRDNNLLPISEDLD